MTFQYWNEVEEFYKRITPKNEKLTELEQKTKIPFHYVLMALTVVLLAVFYIFTRKIFFTFFPFFVAVICNMRSISLHKEEEKKWAVYWLVFTIFQLLPCSFDRNMYFSIIKCICLIYFAAFDDCTLFIQLFDLADKYCKMAWEIYLGFCGGVKTD